MVVSQWRYLDYFDQVLLHGFIPLSRSLILSKVVIMHDPDGEAEASLSLTENAASEEPRYFRVYQGKQMVCVFDQLELDRSVGD